MTLRLIAWLRRTFLRGMLLILPLAITFVILRWMFHLVTWFGTAGTEKALRLLGPSMVDSRLTYLTPLISMFVTIGIVLVVGVVGGNYVGKKAWTAFERILLRLPLVRWFYGSARQLMDAFSLSGAGAFQEVVLVEYPRRGVWCLGFVTGRADGLIPDETAQDVVWVYLPTTPNPTSGYVIALPRSEVVPANMTVDEGLKVIFSGGFLSPPARVASGAGAVPHPASEASP